MKKRFLLLISILLASFCLCACNGLGDGLPFISHPSDSSTFSIQFINVDQGDSALVECDGHYMLIDGGDKSHGRKVYSVLEEKGVQHLDILAISHYHEDHIGGLIEAVKYAQKIDKTIANSLPTSNSNSDETRVVLELTSALANINATITVPHEHDVFKLGSADVEVVDVGGTDYNDSLVLLITYGKTRFLFTGDIEHKAQSRIADKYSSEKDSLFKIDLMKMPHHGSSGSKQSIEINRDSLNKFIITFMPKYAIISAGNDNSYDHPSDLTLSILEDARVEVHTTGKEGDIIARSNGKDVKIETEKDFRG